MDIPIRAVTRWAHTGFLMLIALALTGITACGKEQTADAKTPPAATEGSAKAPGGATMVAPADGKVLAIVNGQEITAGAVNAKFEMMRAHLGLQGQPLDQLDAIRPRLIEQLTERMVMEVLIDAELRKKNITVEDEDVDAMIAKMLSQIPEEMDLAAYVARVNTSEEALRANLRTELQRQRLFEQLVGEAETVTPEAVEEFYETNKETMFNKPETVRARHILLSFEEGESDEAKAAKKKKAEELRQKLIDGADFAEVAKEHSTGPSNVRGGDLGEFGRGRMVPPFDEAAFSQEVDEIGAVIETRFGYHIVQTTERNEPRALAFDEVKEQLTQQLQRQRAQAQEVKARQVITEWREAADISFPGRPAEGSAPNPAEGSAKQ